MAGPSVSAWAFVVMFQGAVSGWLPIDPGTEIQNAHQDQRCERCHLAGRDVTPANARKLTTTQERMCGRCHQGGVEASHPTGFVPQRPLPAGFPLDWKGEVTCSTCHDVHEAAPGRLRSAKKGGEFCQSCHDGAFFETMPEKGISLIGFGHLDARPGPVLRIDSYSMRCVVCHESHVSLPGDGIRATFRPSNSTGIVNHPIGAEARLRVNAGLEFGVRGGTILSPDGKVSCVSCHRAYSREHGALVAPEPELCTQCHDK